VFSKFIYLLATHILNTYDTTFLKEIFQIIFSQKKYEKYDKEIDTSKASPLRYKRLPPAIEHFKTLIF
jgi:hypothetical protein